ncbi:MAG: PfpI family intracellular protease [Myxococcaceae bacterium]|nr:PfpI family intracellular protease [Myxococcaceae bacterium]
MGRLEGKRVAVLATDGFEQSELTSPRKALEAEGAKVEVVAPHVGSIRGWKDKNWGDSVEVAVVLESARPELYDALLLPGGVMSPDQLRRIPAAIDFVGKFVAARKPIAAICHGPLTLVEAGAVDGRRMTSYASIKTDLINAGAKWEDEPYVIDRGLVTSRSPGDLPVFNEKMIEVFAQGPIVEEPVAEEAEEEEVEVEGAPAAEPEPAGGERVLVAPPPAPARRPKRKKVASTGARAKATPRKNGRHPKPRGAKQAPRRRAPKRR